MPNRIIKESICTSDTIDQLTWFEEIVFYRLIVNCDDYGRFDGRTAVIKSRLFPLKSSITEKNVLDAIHKLSTVGLVTLYECDRKPILQLVTWDRHQQVRARKSKYPAFDETCNQMISDDIKCPRNPIQSESNPNPNPTAPAPEGSRKNYAEIKEIYNRICKSYPVCKTLSEARKAAIRARMKSGYTTEDFIRLFELAEQSDFLKGKNKRNWSADFDWLIKDANMAKVLDGNYNKGQTAEIEHSDDLDFIAD